MKRSKRWISIITILMVEISAVACGKATSEPGKNEEVPEVKQNVVETTDTKEETVETLPEEPAAEAEAKLVQPEDDESSFLSKAVAAANAKDEEVRDYLVDDFDCDGVVEAFVFIGGEIDEDWSACEGSLWFVSGENCENVHEYGSILVTDDKIIERYDVSDKSFVAVNDSYATSNVTYLFYVKDGKCKESSVSGRGAFFKPTYVDDYCVSVSAYDAFCDYEAGKEEEGMFTGHTWKNYYFFYDEATGDFAEYKGTPMTESELEEACGFDLAGEIQAEGYQFDNAIKRTNGIINVNYSKKTVDADGNGSIEYKNATFNETNHQFIDVWGDGDGSWQGSDFGGTYLESLI